MRRQSCNHLRELFYDRNPGDARVKVGSERQAASRQRGPNSGEFEIGYFSRAFCPRGPSKIGPSMGRFTPKKLLEGTRAKRQSSSRVRELCLKSDAQLLSTIAHRSLVFLGRIFVLGHPKPSRNRPETARHRNRPETVPKPSRNRPESSTFQSPTVVADPKNKEN